MLEELVEAVVPAIGRALVYICIEVIAHVVFYYTGFVLLRAVTFGKYPQKSRLDLIDTKLGNYIIFTGLVFWVLVFIILIALNWG